MASNVYLLGLALVLVAVGYQYRDELRRLVFSEDGVAHTTRTTLQEQQPADSPHATEEDTATTSDGGKYFNPPFDPRTPLNLYSKSGIRMLTANELAVHAHNGTLRPIWLAVLGHVYDVEKGAEHYYGPDGGYNFFTGRDGSKAFVTGHFDAEGLTDDVDDLTPIQLGELEDWRLFYEKDYTFVGKLIGRYFSKNGSPTKAWYKYLKRLGEREKMRAELRELEKRFPGCNSKWDGKVKGTIYCSEKSGGIHRDWVGYPRRFYSPAGTSFRCACVHPDDLNSPHVKLYPDCDPLDTSCKVNATRIKEMNQRGE